MGPFRVSLWRLLSLLAILAFLPTLLSQQPTPKLKPPTPADLDRKLIADAKKSSEIMINLTHLCDEIGPRLTGSKALRKANDWAAGRMKAYGLVHVRNEPWLMPEGWRRIHARGRIIEPANGTPLALASFGWMPGTKGKVRGNVIVLTASKIDKLEELKGKLRGTIVLAGPPVKLQPRSVLDAPGATWASTEVAEKDEEAIEDRVADKKSLRDFLIAEGVLALLVDAGKHFNLLFTTGGWSKDAERPSATNKLPMVYVGHDQYATLYRLATRPGPAKTRIELDVANEFVPGPIAVYNTVGEIKGSEKPDEFVVVGAHLDSWDLGQGAMDNGTGTCVVLETARLLAKCGTAPKRTIRFVLFTGEEQGLHGARAFVKKHKDEMARTSMCLVHDSGTGKVLLLGWLGRPPIEKILEKELVSLKGLGVGALFARCGGGSDHEAFHEAGVPGCAVDQEMVGYRFAHHSQADTLGLAREGDLIQGAQVLAVTALRIANLEQLLPREKK